MAYWTNECAAWHRRGLAVTSAGRARRASERVRHPEERGRLDRPSQEDDLGQGGPAGERQGGGRSTWIAGQEGVAVARFPCAAGHWRHL